MLDSSEILFRLTRGDAIVGLAVQKQDRRFYLRSVADSGIFPIVVERGVRIAAKVPAVPEGPISCALNAEQIADAGDCDCRLEHAGLRDDPISYKSAIAVADNAHPVSIDPCVLCDRGLHSIHD